MADKIIPTRDLQLFSVAQAMEVLGYKLWMTPTGGYLFYNKSRSNKGNALMSMQRAFMLHNCLGSIDTMGYDIYTVNRFLAAKVVYSVKLQYCKRKKRVFVNGGENANYVAFVDYNYREQFGIGNGG
jgi:hypothetical protein